MTITQALLPNAKQTFYDANGVPLVNGYVYMYIPTTTTPKNTWQDPTASTLNTNPIRLDSLGSALIYGSGQYRQIVKDSSLNLIWDQLTDVSSLIFSNNTITRNTDTNVNQILATLAVNDMIEIDQTSTAGHAFSDTMIIKRTADYTGGSAGWVNAGLYVKDTVGAATTSYEWAIVGSVINSSNAGNSVGVYGQGEAVTATTGPTWAMVAEARDISNTDRTSALIGIEVDIFANGNNTNDNRIGIDIGSGKGDVLGADSQAYAGMRIETENINNLDKYKNGIIIGDYNARSGANPLLCTNGINIFTNGGTGVIDRGTKTVGFDAIGTYSSSAFRMSSGSWFSYEDTDTIKARYNSGTGNIEFYNNATLRFNIATGATPWIVGALVQPTSAQSISDSTDTAITFAATTYNNHSIWSNSNPTRLTCPFTGFIKLHGAVGMAAVTAAGKLFDLVFSKNGSRSFIGNAANNHTPGTADAVKISISSPILSVTAGDYFELIITQTTGGSVNTNYASNNYQVWFAMELVQ